MCCNCCRTGETIAIIIIIIIIVEPKSRPQAGGDRCMLRSVGRLIRSFYRRTNNEAKHAALSGSGSLGMQNCVDHGRSNVVGSTVAAVSADDEDWFDFTTVRMEAVQFTGI